MQDWFVDGELRPIFEQDMNLSYDLVTDALPSDRLKRTHPRGVVTQVQFIAAEGQPYTGCFKGADHGVLRISETTKTRSDVNKTNPGFGMKFFRDGKPSCNMVTMFSFDGQPSYNFFENRWTTILKEFQNTCARNTIGKKLSEVTKHIGATSTLDWASMTADGKVEKDPHQPLEVLAEPADLYNWPREFSEDF